MMQQCVAMIAVALTTTDRDPESRSALDTNLNEFR